MRTLLPFICVLLLGFTTNAKSNNNELSQHYVSFIENEVFYEVFLDGTFTFSLPHHMQYSYFGQRSRSGKTTKADNMSIHYSNNHNTANEYIKMDHSGILYAIGDTQLKYNEAGQLTVVGPIQLSYSEGRLVQIGGMNIFYDHIGQISHTTGNINYTGANRNAKAVKSNKDLALKLKTRRNSKARYSGFGVSDLN